MAQYAGGRTIVMPLVKVMTSAGNAADASDFVQVFA